MTYERWSLFGVLWHYQAIIYELACLCILFVGQNAVSLLAQAGVSYFLISEPRNGRRTENGNFYCTVCYTIVRGSTSKHPVYTTPKVQTSQQAHITTTATSAALNATPNLPKYVV